MNLSSIHASASLGATINQTSDSALNSTQTLEDQDSTSLSANGVGAGNVDGVYRRANLSIPSTAPLTIDLTALTDLNGNALPVSNVVAFKIRNTTVAGGGNLIVGGGSSAALSAQLPIEAGGKSEWDGIKNGGLSIPVAAGTKNLLLAGSAGTVTGTLTLFTRST